MPMIYCRKSLPFFSPIQRQNQVPKLSWASCTTKLCKHPLPAEYIVKNNSKPWNIYHRYSRIVRILNHTWDTFPNIQGVQKSWVLQNSMKELNSWDKLQVRKLLGWKNYIDWGTQFQNPGPDLGPVWTGYIFLFNTRFTKGSFWPLWENVLLIFFKKIRISKI